VRRAWRIVPTYYLSMLLSIVLIATVIGEPLGTHWDVSLPVTWRDVGLHLALVHEWFESSAFKINHPHWSVAVEWKIYFFFPLLVMLYARFTAWKVALSTLVLGYGLWLVLRWTHAGNPSPWGSSPYYLGLFAFGMLAADVSESGVRRSARWLARCRGVFVALTAAAVFFSLVRKPNGDHIAPQWLSSVIGGWAAVLLVILRNQALPLLNRLVCCRPAVSLGKIGYSVYLLHAPLIQVAYLYVIRTMHVSQALRAPLMLLSSAVLTVLVAVPFYAWAERPFHALSRRA